MASVTSSADIPCNRFTFERFESRDPSNGWVTWLFWDHSTGNYKRLRFSTRHRRWWVAELSVLQSFQICEAMKSQLPPEEIAKATALSLTGGQVA